MWPAVGAIGGSLISGLFGHSGQQSANEANVKLWREQRDYNTQMDNSAVQRRMKDMAKAGINPMLAGGAGGAADNSAASAGPPRVESTQKESAASAATLASVLADIKMKNAQARKTNADAAITEQDIPYSGQSAKERYYQLTITSDKLLGEARSALAKGDVDIGSKEWDMLARQYAKDYADYVQQAAKLGIPEKKADAEFWSGINKTGKDVEFWVKVMQGAKNLLSGK